jgi:hypothetical protein
VVEVKRLRGGGYGMVTRGFGPYERPLEALDASRRVGWARAYAQQERAEQLAALNSVLRDRLDTLLPEFLDLVDAVLHRPNVEAFRRAYRVRALIDEAMRGSGGMPRNGRPR